MNYWIKIKDKLLKLNFYTLQKSKVLIRLESDSMILNLSKNKMFLLYPKDGVTFFLSLLSKLSNYKSTQYSWSSSNHALIV